MAYRFAFRQTVIAPNAAVLPGRVICSRGGRVVWAGSLSEPWEDVDADKFFLSLQDYATVKFRTLPDGRTIP